MPFPLLAVALTWLGRIGLAAFAVNEIKKLTTPQKTTMDQGVAAAKDAGVTDDELKKLVAATTYDKVEESGQSPDAFWGSLDQKAKDELKFSPESLRESMGRTKFLGIAQTLTWVAAGVAAGYGGFKGIPILLSTLAKLRDARAAGASALTLMTIIEEGKIAGIAKVWIPGLIASLAAAGGWLTGGLTNNLNDALLWGRIFLDQAASDIDKASKARGTGGGSGGASAAEPIARTRITISKTEEPKVAVGTLFQSIVKDTTAFKRVVDDQITSAEDLKNDVQLNLNKWLASLPGRLHYEIRIVLNPLDEDGNKKLGTWAVLLVGHRNSQGIFQHLQAVPLGPIEPTIYRPTTREIQTIQLDIPKLLTSEEVINLNLPTYGLRTVDRDGNVAPISFGGSDGAGNAPTKPSAVSAIVENITLSKSGQYYKAGTDVYEASSNRKLTLEEFKALGLNFQLLPERSAPAGAGQPAPQGGVPINAEDDAPQGSRVERIGTQLYYFPAGKPFISFLGSPDVFFRVDGSYIPQAEAIAKKVNLINDVEQLTYPRPEVKSATDYAQWAGKNLTQGWQKPTTKNEPLLTAPDGSKESAEQRVERLKGERSNAWQATTVGILTYVPMPEEIRLSLALPPGYGASNGVLFSSFEQYQSKTGRSQ